MASSSISTPPALTVDQRLSALCSAWELCFRSGAFQLEELSAVVGEAIDRTSSAPADLSHHRLTAFRALAFVSTHRPDESLASLQSKLVSRFIQTLDPWSTQHPANRANAWGWAALVDAVRHRISLESIDELLKAPGAPPAEELTTTFLSAGRGLGHTRWNWENKKAYPDRFSVLGWALHPAPISFRLVGDGDFSPCAHEVSPNPSMTLEVLSRLFALGMDPNAAASSNGRRPLELSSPDTYLALARAGAQPCLENRRPALALLSERSLKASQRLKQGEFSESLLNALKEPWEEGLWTAEQARSVQKSLECKIAATLLSDTALQPPAVLAFMERWQSISGQPPRQWLLELALGLADRLTTRPKDFQAKLNSVVSCFPLRVLKEPLGMEFSPGVDAQQALLMLRFMSSNTSETKVLNKELSTAACKALVEAPPGAFVWRAAENLETNVSPQSYEDFQQALDQQVRKTWTALMDEESQHDRPLQKTWLEQPQDLSSLLRRSLGALAAVPDREVPKSPDKARWTLALGLVHPKTQKFALRALTHWKQMAVDGRLPVDVVPEDDRVKAALLSQLASQVAAKDPEALALYRQTVLESQLASTSEAPRRPRM
jgi:hypothetical protein